MIKSNKTRRGDWIFVIICVLVAAICLIPMLNLAARSLSSSQALIKHEVSILPKGLNFTSYEYVFGNAKYVKSFFWTVFLTFICTLVSVHIRLYSIS